MPTNDAQALTTYQPWPRTLFERRMEPRHSSHRCNIMRVACFARPRRVGNGSSMFAQFYNFSASIALACALAGPVSAADSVRVAALDGNTASIGSAVTAPAQ